ncbi:MAG: MoaD/ThiS family protein [Nitrosomonadales bacterium]|nr:MoaD/ThiS family protein [Nitrosomonadales bacterium]
MDIQTTPVCQMKIPFFPASLERRHEIAIMYFGRVSDYLAMTSERMAVPDGKFTLEQMLNKLRMRGKRWAYELDDSCVVCTVNGKAAWLSDIIAAGDEIEILSNRSVFEI